MSRQIWCDACGQRPHFGAGLLKIGRYELLPESNFGEPAEWVRVVKGIARRPTPEQRVMTINDEAFPLNPDSYTCDDCNADIKPGQVAWCVTVFTPGYRGEPAAWESAFVESEESA